MTAFTRGRAPLWIVLAGGALLGALYSASPLTTLCVPAVAWLTARIVRDASPRERQWVIALVTVAVTLRLVAIAVLFLTAGPEQPFATFFGDEEFFKHRSMWRRNVGLGVPISTADTIYLFDEVGWSSYLYILAFIQAVVGAAPYGVHVLNVSLYVASVLLVYRLARPAFGGAAALIGLVVLLFWPTLFVWSISALKEPLYCFVAAVELWGAVVLVRARTWRTAGYALIAIVAGMILLEGIRRGGLAMVLPGLILGTVLSLLAPRPRLALATLAALPVVMLIALSFPPVQERVLSLLQRSVSYHAGHVGSSGIAYQIVEPRYYRDPGLTREMPPRELAAFVVKATASYFGEPLPWHAESRLLKAYLPEQMAWLLLVLCAVAGIVAGFRLDAVMTGMLVGHAIMAIAVVAMTSGNIGTLIRHRGLAMPYLAWLAGVGFCELVRLAMPAPANNKGGQLHGDR